MAHVEGAAAFFIDTPECKERVWSFRLTNCRDEKNRIVPEIQVEIRGKHMKGQITEQDIIIVREKFKKGKNF